MNKMKEQFVRTGKWSAAVLAAALLLLSGMTGTLAAQSSPGETKAQNQAAVTQGKFYCNIKALTPAERARHKELGDKMFAAKDATVETEKGYEFQFSPEKVSVAEVAEWVVAESKCCPFFDFHIDLEREGKLVCLRLTGSEGVKQFIRTELGVEAKEAQK
jgi:hypothetical protein